MIRQGLARLLASLLVGWIGCVGIAGAQALAPWAADPVYVFYPRGECDADQIELQTWDRERERWGPHPGHRRVTLGTCQVEDAGTLLNEMRWRCLEPADTEPPPLWVTGIDVFDLEVMQRCAVEDQVTGNGRVQFKLNSPGERHRVTSPTFEVPVDGSVWLNGAAGDDYDLLLGIDRSSSTEEAGRDLLRAQTDAAHALVDRLATRLGRVRVGLFSFPNMPPLPGTGDDTGARSEIDFTADPAALHRAIDRLKNRKSSGFQTFPSALDYGIRKLGDPLKGGEARPRARRVLVLAANAFEGRPYGPEAVNDERFHAALAEQIQRAKDARIALHLYAVGGLSERLAPEMRSVIEAGEAEFDRVLGPTLRTAFFNQLSLPIVSSVALANKTLGGPAEAAAAQPDGRFRGLLAVQPGINRAWARVTLSDGTTQEHEWSFEFDDSEVKERWLGAERERMRQVRQQKRLELRPLSEAEDRLHRPDVSPPPAPDPLPRE